MTKKIAVLGNFPPRQCGIATFTADLVGALANYERQASVFAVAMNDAADGYNYPEQVRFELAQTDLLDYHRTADFLNLQNVEVVSVQHEFGIFGGPAGSHLLTLLRELRAPVVTTLHTVLEHPDAAQRAVMDELGRRSERLVVMSELGRQFLGSIYGIPSDKIDLIPHGIPNVPFTDANFYKDAFNVEGKTVLLTFGLLSPNKGLEHAIRALPEIVAAHPDVVYIILGATHPHLLRHEGESYRLSLQRLARALGVEDHVVFYDRFVELDELLNFIGAADVYVTPYTNREQITSGTLAYALGAGKAIVSTPYWYAEELLAEGRGVLTPFADPAALAENVLALLGNDAERHAMRKRAYMHGRAMVWSEVAARYTESFGRARARWSGGSRPALPKPLSERPTEFPPLELRHLHHLTDDTGIVQHALYTVPNYAEGYTTDDNARALIAGVELEGYGDRDVRSPSARYLAFLTYAFDPATRRFRNFMSYDRRWLEAVGSEDAHGRAVWALGTVLGGSHDANLRGVASHLFEQALPETLSFTSPRAWAFALLGVGSYLERFWRGPFGADRTVHAGRASGGALHRTEFSRLGLVRAGSKLLQRQTAARPDRGGRQSRTARAHRIRPHYAALADRPAAERRSPVVCGQQRVFSAGRGARRRVRSATRRGARTGVGVSGGAPRHRRPGVAPRSAPRVRVVFRRKRPRLAALRPAHRRLPRRAPRRPRQSESGGRIDVGLFVVALRTQGGRSGAGTFFRGCGCARVRRRLSSTAWCEKRAASVALNAALRAVGNPAPLLEVFRAVPPPLHL